MPESSNPALTRLFDLLLTAFYHSGHSFTCKSAGVTDELESLLQRYGFHNIHHRLVSTHYHVGMNTWQPFFEDMKLTFRMILPFLHKWTIVPDDYEEIYQQALQEMLLTDFVASGGILTVWGQKEEQ